jgi:RIP metalloprotease RseP
LRKTGISPATTLIIEPQIAKEPALVKEIYELTGFYPGDEVKAINGQAVQTPWDFAAKEAVAFMPETAISVSRQWPQDTADDEKTTITISVPMNVAPAVDNFRDELDLAHFAGMVPRLKVEDAFEVSTVSGLPSRIMSWFKKTVLRKENPSAEDSTCKLEKGDIILKIADQDLPNFKQLRETAEEFKDKNLLMTVLRKDEDGAEKVMEVTVYPKTDPSSKRVLMGIVPVLDMDSPVVAQVVNGSGQAVLPGIATGAIVTAVDGQPVESFYDIAQLLQQNAGQKVAVDYVLDGQAGGTAVMIPQHEPVHAKASIGVGIPFADLTHEFKASNPVMAIKMGLKKTWQFVLRSYITLIRLFQRTVSPSALSGPVGIISMSYDVAGTTLSHYLYFLGLISSCLAVMNLLPLPVLDGGHIVILIIEKISGKPINERVLAAVMYTGMALLLGVMLWITYFDLNRIIFGR